MSLKNTWVWSTHYGLKRATRKAELKLESQVEGHPAQLGGMYTGKTINNKKKVKECLKFPMTMGGFANNGKRGKYPVLCHLLFGSSLSLLVGVGWRRDGGLMGKGLCYELKPFFRFPCVAVELLVQEEGLGATFGRQGQSSSPIWFMLRNRTDAHWYLPNWLTLVWGSSRTHSHSSSPSDLSSASAAP